MKNVICFLALAISTSTALAAQKDIVCTKTAGALDITIVVSEAQNNDLTMKVYRTFHGRTFQSEIVPVKQLPGSRGPVLAYGDEGQTKILTMNLHKRNTKNQVLGTYEDSTKGAQALDVTCTL